MPRVRRDQQMRDQPRLGLVCRMCGCQHFRVIYLRRLQGGVILRRRECRHCGHRTTTRETQV